MYPPWESHGTTFRLPPLPPSATFVLSVDPLAGLTSTFAIQVAGNSGALGLPPNARGKGAMDTSLFSVSPEVPRMILATEKRARGATP